MKYSRAMWVPCPQVLTVKWFSYRGIGRTLSLTSLHRVRSVYLKSQSLCSWDLLFLFQHHLPTPPVPKIAGGQGGGVPGGRKMNKIGSVLQWGSQCGGALLDGPKAARRCQRSSPHHDEKRYRVCIQTRIPDKGSKCALPESAMPLEL